MDKRFLIGFGLLYGAALFLTASGCGAKVEPNDTVDDASVSYGVLRSDANQTEVERRLALDI